MICYRDMTFCKWWDSCKDGADCPRALTPEALCKADRFGLPICQYDAEPPCYNKQNVADKDSSQ